MIIIDGMCNKHRFEYFKLELSDKEYVEKMYCAKCLYEENQRLKNIIKEVSTLASQSLSLEYEEGRIFKALEEINKKLKELK